MLPTPWPYKTKTEKDYVLLGGLYQCKGRFKKIEIEKNIEKEKDNSSELLRNDFVKEFIGLLTVHKSVSIMNVA